MNKLLIAAFLLSVSAMAAPVQIQIDCAKPTVELSPYLYGLFFEDINYGADGGLYAELVQNRSFEYFNIEPRDRLREKTAGDMNPMYAWEVIERGGGKCRTTVSRWTPLNRANENYLTIYIDKPGDGIGVANLGYDGTPAPSRSFLKQTLNCSRINGTTTALKSLRLMSGKSRCFNKPRKTSNASASLKVWPGSLVNNSSINLLATLSTSSRPRIL